jgi:hypothetical protein
VNFSKIIATLPEFTLRKGKFPNLFFEKMKKMVVTAVLTPLKKPI